VIHAIFEQHIERRVCLRLRDFAKRRRAKQRARAIVSCASKWNLRNHAKIVVPKTEVATRLACRSEEQSNEESLMRIFTH